MIPLITAIFVAWQLLLTTAITGREHASSNYHETSRLLDELDTLSLPKQIETTADLTPTSIPQPISGNLYHSLGKTLLDELEDPTTHAPLQILPIHSPKKETLSYKIADKPPTLFFDPPTSNHFPKNFLSNKPIHKTPNPSLLLDSLQTPQAAITTALQTDPFQKSEQTLTEEMNRPYLPQAIEISSGQSPDTSPIYQRDLQLSTTERGIRQRELPSPEKVEFTPIEPIQQSYANQSPVHADFFDENSPSSSPQVDLLSPDQPYVHKPLPSPHHLLEELQAPPISSTEPSLKIATESSSQWKKLRSETENRTQEYDYAVERLPDFSLYEEAAEEYEPIFAATEGECLEGPCDGERFPVASAVCAALCCQRDIKIAQLGMAVTKGSFCQSAGPFDLFLEGSIEHLTETDVRDSGIITDFTGHNTAISLQATKQFRCSGTQFRLGFDTDYRDFATQFDPTFFRRGGTRLFFNVEQPLLRGRGCSLEAAREMGAFHDWQASKMAALQVISERVEFVLARYWDAVAARKLLEIDIESEKRLIRLVENTKRLIAANTLAASEIDQPLARLARQKVRRTASEQNLYAAIQALTVSIGYNDDRYIVNPTQCFLDELPNPETWITEHSEVIEPLIETALCCRYDIQEAELQVKRTDVLWKGANNAKKTELNLIGRVSIIDEKYGTHADALDDILRFNQPQKDYRVGVRISRPLYNMEACGCSLRSRAEYEQAQLNLDNLRLNAVAELRQSWGEHISLAIQAPPNYWRGQTL